MRRHAKNSPRRRGKVLVLVALALTVLLGMVGLTVDSGLLQTARRQVQNAADAGALAAAMELFRGNTLDGACAVATTVIQSNSGFTDPAVTITVQTPMTGSYSGNPNYVEVIVSLPQTVYLMPLLGVSSTQTMVARAVAGYEANPLGEGVILLDPTAIPGLAVHDNGTLRVNGAIVINSRGAGLDQYSNAVIWDWPGFAAVTNKSVTVQADYVLVHGGVDTPDNFSNIVTGGPNPVFAKGPIVSNPLRDLPVPTDQNGAVIATKGAVKFPNGDSNPAPLNPGVYEDISITSGANVTFNPGIYILSPTTSGQGLTITGNPTVNANGVMFYVTGDDYLPNAKYDRLDTPLDGPLSPGNGALPAAPDPAVTNFASFSINTTRGQVNMTALQDGSSPFNGILLYQRPRNKHDVTVAENGGGDVTLSGTLYAQWAAMKISANGTYNAQFLVGSMNVSGSGTITINPGGKSFNRANQVFLVE